MATLRNLAFSVLRLAGAQSIAKALRWCSRNRQRALRLIGLGVPARAVQAHIPSPQERGCPRGGPVVAGGLCFGLDPTALGQIQAGQPRPGATLPAPARGLGDDRS